MASAPDGNIVSSAVKESPFLSDDGLIHYKATSQIITA